jgi:hypothetical protein
VSEKESLIVIGRLDLRSLNVAESVIPHLDFGMQDDTNLQLARAE